MNKEEKQKHIGKAKEKLLAEIKTKQGILSMTRKISEAKITEIEKEIDALKLEVEALEAFKIK